MTAVSWRLHQGQRGIHSFVEETLTERIGEAGKRLHTGRSRNDQVALDMKLYTRDEIKEIDGLVKDLLQELLVIMGKQFRYLYAGIYPSAKGSAHHPGSPYGSVF